MMSPDPPREDRPSSESDTLPTPPDPTFIAVWDDGDGDEDIFGDADGPYELDIGGSEESDFSDSGDDLHVPGQGGHYQTGQARDQPQPQGQGDNGNQGENVAQDFEESPTRRMVETGSRGHYHLLIPFPPPQMTEEEDNIQNGSNYSTQSLPGTSTTVADENNGTVMESSSDIGVAEPPPQRDINLTEENVQVIKSVMMNFSLPSASIPPWASQISDESLKKQLSGCLDGKKGE